MNSNKKLEIGAILRNMRHSSIRNYALPGLTSYLIGGEKHGMIRMFEADRNITEIITPHSHRFDFAAYVLEGWVTNITYRRAQSMQEYNRKNANPWWVSFLEVTRGVNGKPIPGDYFLNEGYGPVSFTEELGHYVTGMWYTVKHDDIHSIHFEKGTRVLMLEGPQVTDRTTILEPFANGKRVPTFNVAPWMFDRTAR